MREGAITFGFRIVVMDMFYSRLFDNYPSDEEMKEVVSHYFPTFHVEGNRVTWKVEKIYYLND